MARVIVGFETFEIPDDEAQALKRTKERDLYQKKLIESRAQLDGQMVFIEITAENSDIYCGGKEQAKYGPIFVVHRAVVKEGFSVLWMPNFSARVENIQPLRDFYPIIDKLVVERTP